MITHARLEWNMQCPCIQLEPFDQHYFDVLLFHQYTDVPYHIRTGKQKFSEIEKLINSNKLQATI